MKKIIVIGGGGHAKVVISIIKKLKEYKTIGYTDSEDKGSILGVKYLGKDENIKNYDVSLLAIGVGIISNNKNNRAEIINRLLAQGYRFPSIVSPNAIVNEDISIGEGTVIMDGVVVNSGTKVGDYSIINTKSTIDHDCSVGSNIHVAPGVTLCGGVEIGDRSFIGAGATILQYKKIGKNCLIGAGAIVVDDCDNDSKYLGQPAKKR